MWAEFCKRWFDLCRCWLPTTKDEQTSGAEAKPSPTMADEVSTDLRTTGGEDSVGPEAGRNELGLAKGAGIGTVDGCRVNFVFPAQQKKLDQLFAEMR